jgi:hypothetical protein
VLPVPRVVYAISEFEHPTSLRRSPGPRPKVLNRRLRTYHSDQIDDLRQSRESLYSPRTYTAARLSSSATCSSGHFAVLSPTTAITSRSPDGKTWLSTPYLGRLWRRAPLPMERICVYPNVEFTVVARNLCPCSGGTGRPMAKPANTHLKPGRGMELRHSMPARVLGLGMPGEALSACLKKARPSSQSFARLRR